MLSKGSCIQQAKSKKVMVICRSFNFALRGVVPEGFDEPVTNVCLCFILYFSKSLNFLPLKCFFSN